MRGYAMAIKSKPDWEKWGKIKRTTLHQAVGLLVGIDFEKHRTFIDILKIGLDVENNEREKQEFYKQQREQLDIDANESIKSITVHEVIRNHIENNCFIPMIFEEWSEKETKAYFESNWENERINGTKYGIPTVNLEEFGTWAKSAGYDLPPEFPISESTTKPNIKKLEIPPDLKKYSLDLNRVENDLVGNFIDIKTLPRSFYILRTTNAWKRIDKDELIKCVVTEYLKDLNLACESSGISFDQGLRQLLKQIIGKHTDEYFISLYESALSMLQAYEKINNAVEPIVPQQASEPIKSSQNTNKKEWELIEEEYMKMKTYELIPLVMKSLNIDPMAYPPQHNKSGLKKELHTQGGKIFNKRFRMNLESFSKGKKSAWSMAKNNNLIRESE